MCCIHRLKPKRPRKAWDVQPVLRCMSALLSFTHGFPIPGFRLLYEILAFNASW